MVMHSHSNKLGAIHMDLQMAVEQVKAQKEMILGLVDVNKHLETEQDHLWESLQEDFSQIAWLYAQVVTPREVLEDSSDDSNDSNDDKNGPDEGQDEGSTPESEGSSDSYQQPSITGSGAQFMEYIGGSNRLVLIVDGLDGKVLMEVAQLIESRVVPTFKEHIFNRQLLPLFVWCKHCGV